MNSIEFISQLEGLLSDIPAAEKEEAIQYYRDYFEDAGEENEQSVILQLGSPSKVAETIKAELSAERVNGLAKPGDHAIIRYGEWAEEPLQEQQAPEEKNWKPEEKSWKSEADAAGSYSPWAIALLIAAAVIVLPTMFGILAGVVGTLVGLLVGWFAIILAFGIVALALFFSAVVLAVVGIACAAASPLTCITLIGAGLICAGIGTLFLMLTVFLGGTVTPLLWKGVLSFLGWIRKLITGIRAKRPAKKILA